MTMKHVGSVVVAVAFLAVVAAIIGFAVKLIGGLVSGALNFFLGTAVVIALIVIVIWMFAYAAKH